MQKEEIKKQLERLLKPFRIPFRRDGEPLTEEQKRRRARFVVYPLMGLLCLGSLYLIFSPSKEEETRQNRGKGFNTEIPSPEDKELEGNKKDAYEKALLEQESRKRKTFFDTAESMFRNEQPKDSVCLPDTFPKEPDADPERMEGPAGAVTSSAGAYRQMNRTLGSIYEPAADPEKEKLLERIEELERQQADRQETSPGMEEKMALMEKSYELAARYNSRQAAPSAMPAAKAEDRPAMPVKRLQNQVVSSLSAPLTEEEFLSVYAGERNTGFHTPVGRKTVTTGNTIAACVHGTQTVSDGQALRLRLTEPMAVADRFIPKGTVLVGSTRIQGERLEIVIHTLEAGGSILPVELEVYDTDGQQGILIPHSLEYDAAREIAANMGSSMNSSINISTDAGAQIASDVGKGVLQGVSQYITKRMRTVKVTLKAGHRVLLHSPEQ